MLRIVGIQRSRNPQEEFILLQNQSALRTNLRGSVIMSEFALDNQRLAGASYLLLEDQVIAGGQFVLLWTGEGESHWSKTRDGAYAYNTYMNYDEAFWVDLEGPIHLLTAQHTYVEPKQTLLLT